MNHMVVLHRFLHPLQNDRPCPLAPHGTVSPGIEGADHFVGRVNQGVTLGRKIRQGYARHNGDINLALLQGLRCQTYGGQTGGTGCVHNQARPVQIEIISDSAGQNASRA
ncbi:hypothetical protein D3C73_1475890 [compost metagenome]